MRIKRAVNAVKQRRKIMKQAKGYYAGKRSLYRVAKQQLLEFSASRFVDVFDGTKISLSLGCLLGKKVAVCRMASLVKTACCNVETLLCSAMCFLFWHRSASYFILLLLASKQQ